jgi:dienelactone hydrolase
MQTNSSQPIHSSMFNSILTLLGLLAAFNAAFAQPTIQFSATIYGVAENAGTVSLTVQRTNDTHTEVSVDYATADGTATNGLKYTATNGTLAFAVGETNQAIVVPILNEGFVEGLKTFTVTLSNPTGGAVLGAAASATVWITDNDTGLQFEFGSSTFGSYRVGESEGFILLGATRGDDGNFPVSVNFATSDSTATNGLDYTATNGTLTFAPGQKVALFTVPILNDGLKESSESFSVTLSNPTNQVLGSQKIATVTIVDDDPGVQFQPFNQYWIAENEGALRLTVARGNDVNLEPFTVDFATSDLTATNGLDYLGTNGTLSFAQGEMVKTITVPILYDEMPEADKKFKVTLSNPAGGAVLGPYATATNTILDTTGMKPHWISSIELLPDRSVQLTFAGGLHTRFHDYFDLYPIEVSSNLVDWTPLVTLLRTNADTNVLTCTDWETTNHATRFYRTPTNHLLTPFFLKPSGPYPVGVVSRLLTDPARRNRYNLSTNGSFMVSIWYPAVAQAGRLPPLFLELPLAQDPALSSGFTDRMPYLRSHALADVPCATNQTPYPIVLFSHGHTGVRARCSEKGPSLASHGYVVLAMDHYDAAATVFPDGTCLKTSVPSDTSVGTQDRVNDLIFIMDELERWNADDPVFAGRLDLTRVAAMGGSWGGETAAEFGRIDARCKAYIGLDPSLGRTPLLSQYGVQKPLLEITSPEYNDTSLYIKNTKDAVWFQLSGAAHAQVTGDLSYWIAYASDLPDGREMARTINAYALWFLNKYLRGSSDPVPTPANYPLVTGFKQK